MAAKDKNGRAFESGQTVTVVSDGKPHPSGPNPTGTYEGTVVGVHEDGPHVETEDGTRTTPFAADCEITGPAQ